MPEAFLPRKVEDNYINSYRTFNAKMQAYAKDAKAVERGQRLLRKYNEKPWLSPGVAVAFTKWEEKFGTEAARGLAGEALDASMSGGNRKQMNKQLEDYVATKDFQRQVKAFRDGQEDDGGGGFFASITDAAISSIPGVGVGYQAGMKITGKSIGKELAPIHKAEWDTIQSVPGVKPVTRGVFTALESPYQEVQAAASSGLAHVAQAFGQSVQGPPRAPGISAGGGVGSDTVDIGVGDLTVGGGSPFGTSTGAIALSHLVEGEPVDLGEGFFPGGEVLKEHERAVRNIASLQYGGQRHFATPGRIFAATVSEPGTDPYNVLSGLVDAAAVIKYDPANIALTKYSELNKARKGFSAPAAELEAAGGFKSWVRSFIDPPTVDRYLAGRSGTRLKQELARMGPDQFTELGRRTNWTWDIDTMTGVTRAETPEAVDAILRPALGTTIDRQPALHSFSAAIRNTTAQHAMMSEIPGVRLRIDAQSLQGQNGSLKALYNHGLGLGLDDRTISRHLFDFAANTGKVSRSEGLIRYMDMEKAGLLAKGVPESEATRLTKFAHEDLFGRARVYTDHEMMTGEHIPGVVLTGSPFPVDKPFLLSEHLGDTIYLNPLQGKGGRNEALAKYGRVLNIPGTSFGENLDEFGFAARGTKAGLSAAGRKVVEGAWRSNSFLTHMQNSLWKPLALIRGAWMVRVLGEEQVRLGMAGYDAMWNHPIRYFGWLAAKKEGTLPETLNWAEEMGGLRNSQRGAFGLLDPEASSYGKIVARNTGTFAIDDPSHSHVWANTLIRYSEDPVMSNVARSVHEGVSLDDVKAQFFQGNLATFRADLSNDPNFLANGIDLSTKAGADTYIDNLYDRLHYYTSGDGDLIETVANGQYRPDIEALASSRSLKGKKFNIEDDTVEVIGHRKGSNEARVLYPDGRDEMVNVSDLTVTDGDSVKILTRNRNDVAVDRDFVAHLGSRDVMAKPPEVSGTHIMRDNPHADTFVNFMFANMMDRPTTYLNRSTVFMQEYYNELERLLPHMAPEARREALTAARKSLKGKLKGRYDELVESAQKQTGGELTHAEAEVIAKSKSLDRMRELLYDTHRKNKGLAAIQLIFPFGEAWKEMLGSWARIVAEKPQTVRKLQVAVNGARGANPFDYVPGAIPDTLQGQGFFYKDPANGGQDNFVYPWSGAINEQLIGVPIPFTAQGQNLSMGFNLLPGVGPVFQTPAMYALNTYMSDPKWDPVRHLISPFGSGEDQGGIGDQIEAAFMPAYFKKFLVANPLTTPHAGPNSQSARALNSTISDIMKYRQSTGEADLNSEAGIRQAYKDASADARWLYMIQGSFQFGAPAAPKANFLAETKNGKLVQFDLLRTALGKLYDDPKVDNPVGEFIKRYGENAMYVVAPKTLGETFGEQFTKTAVDWERRNPEFASKYPLVFALFAPTKKGEDFNYTSYFQALGQRETLPAKEAVRHQNNVLGSMWYDRVRETMGLKPGDTGTASQRAYLQDVRNDIHKGYPGWREVAVDPSRLPRAIEQLTEAVNDPQMTKNRPALARDVKRYLTERDWVMEQVDARGGSGDFQSPNFAQANKWASYRAHLRKFAEELGAKNPSFMTLWEDTFDREMAED